MPIKTNTSQHTRPSLHVSRFHNHSAEQTTQTPLRVSFYIYTSPYIRPTLSSTITALTRCPSTISVFTLPPCSSILCLQATKEMRISFPVLLASNATVRCKASALVTPSKQFASHKVNFIISFP